jgi:hypothetical protein
MTLSRKSDSALHERLTASNDMVGAISPITEARRAN